MKDACHVDLTCSKSMSTLRCHSRAYLFCPMQSIRLHILCQSEHSESRFVLSVIIMFVMFELTIDLFWLCGFAQGVCDRRRDTWAS